jgi:hypothetical protein
LTNIVFAEARMEESRGRVDSSIIRELVVFIEFKLGGEESDCNLCIASVFELHLLKVVS